MAISLNRIRSLKIWQVGLMQRRLRESQVRQQQARISMGIGL